MDEFKMKLLRKIDKMVGYNKKLEFLNDQFIKADTIEKEKTILKMIQELKFWSKLLWKIQ